MRDAEHEGGTARLAARAEAFCRRVHEGLADADFDRKRALLEPLIDRVVAAGGGAGIRYAVPTGPDGGRQPFWRLRTDYLAVVGPAIHVLGVSTQGDLGLVLQPRLHVMAVL